MRVPLSFSREAASPEKGRFRKNSCVPSRRSEGMRKGQSFCPRQTRKPLKAESSSAPPEPCSVQKAARQFSGWAASDPPAQEEGRQVCL